MAQTHTKKQVNDMADFIEGTDAAGVLCELGYRSFCGGSDRLIELGLIDIDGQESDLAVAVKKELLLRDKYARMEDEHNAAMRHANGGDGAYHFT